MNNSNEDKPVTLQQIKELFAVEREHVDKLFAVEREHVSEQFAKERKHTNLKLYEERKYTKQLISEAIQPLAEKIDGIKAMLEGDHAAVVEDVENHEERIIVLEHKTASLHV